MSRVNPFSTPGSVDNETAAPSARQYHFRPPTTLGNGLRGALAAFVLLTLALLGVMAYGLQLLQQGIAGGITAELQNQLDRAGWLQLNLFRLQLVLMLACYIWAGCWIHRVACNVRALGARGLDDPPGWAVGWYAVPVMNLVRPLRAMTQIWLASQSPARWQKLGTPSLLRAWWVFWIAGNLSYWFVTQYLRPEHTFEGLHTQQLLLLCGQGLNLAAAALFLLVVTGLTRMQVEQHEHQQAVPPLQATSLADAFVA
ncbi:MAG TPA: DUF4328 domain-containing protein [Frateuria sp.]|uniref:DUF4328 domain-containing protein n=1 Tax=Frateuria sp. TaxID=2211372 RepID=UPI002D80614F|nr:DUF4328 domain-containing protein [Frateuria sp.]HET6806975.1 DUF4328 domain-containing protein [Frateuria sp.]